MIRSVLATITRGASCVAAGAPRGFMLILLVVAVSRSLQAQRQVPPAVPASVRELFAGPIDRFGQRSSWSEHVRPDGARLWIGVTHVGAGLDRVISFAVTSGARSERAQLIATLDGRLVLDCHPTIVVSTDSLLVVDMIHDDTWGRGARVTMWLDRELRRPATVIHSRQFERTFWHRTSSSFVAIVQTADSLLAIAEFAADRRTLGLRLDRRDLDPTETPIRRNDRYYDVYRSPVSVIPGDPPVFLTESRLGRLVGSDTQWASLPEPSDSLKRAAWTRHGRYEDYELENYLDCCLRNGDLVYGGVGFYSGEGMNGVGGLVVYSASSGSIEVQRWPELLNWPSTPIAVARDTLWILRSAQGEYRAYGGGLLVADMRTGRRRVQWAPGVVVEHQSAGGSLILSTEQTLGVANGAEIRWWTPIPTATGGWTLVKVPAPTEHVEE